MSSVSELQSVLNEESFADGTEPLLTKLEVEDMAFEALKKKEQGNTAYRARKYDEAIALYNEAIALDNTEISFYNNKGAVHFEKGQFDATIEVCTKAVKIGRNYRADYKHIAKSLSRIGKAYTKKGDAHNAMIFYDKAIDEHIENSSIKESDEIKVEDHRLEYQLSEISKELKQTKDQNTDLEKCLNESLMANKSKSNIVICQPKASLDMDQLKRDNEQLSATVIRLKGQLVNKNKAEEKAKEEALNSLEQNPIELKVEQTLTTEGVKLSKAVDYGEAPFRYPGTSTLVDDKYCLIKETLFVSKPQTSKKKEVSNLAKKGRISNIDYVQQQGSIVPIDAGDSTSEETEKVIGFSFGSVKNFLTENIEVVPGMLVDYIIPANAKRERPKASMVFITATSKSSSQIFNIEVPKGWIRGKVSHINIDTIYMKPLNDMPDSYSDDDVCISREKFSNQCLPLKINDEVDVYLEQYSKKIPLARHVTNIVYTTHRTTVEIVAYFNTFITNLMNVRNSDSVLLETLPLLPQWHFIANFVSENDDYVFLLISVVSSVLNRAMKTSYNLRDMDMFTRDWGWFSHFDHW